MQTQTSQPHKHRGSIPTLAMAVTLLTSAAFSTGGVDDTAAPAKLSGVAVRAAGAKEAAAGPGHRSSDRPTRPTCAGLGKLGSTPEAERTTEASGTVGCGIPGNFAGGLRPGAPGAKLDTQTEIGMQS
jgi:hypothetical protein